MVCAPDEARQQVHQERLDRKHSSDGKTLVKLGAELTAFFFARIETAHDTLDLAIQDLVRIHAAMAEGSVVETRRRDERMHATKAS